MGFHASLLKCYKARKSLRQPLYIYPIWEKIIDELDRLVDGALTLRITHIQRAQ